MTPEDPNAAKRGEVWLVSFDPTQGAEMRKTRPAVVLNAEGMGRHALKIVAPITTWDDEYAAWPWMCFLAAGTGNGLEKDSAADASQVKSISIERMQQKIGDVGADDLHEIVSGVGLCIDL